MDRDHVSLIREEPGQPSSHLARAAHDENASRRCAPLDSSLFLFSHRRSNEEVRDPFRQCGFESKLSRSRAEASEDLLLRGEASHGKSSGTLRLPYLLCEPQ